MLASSIIGKVKSGYVAAVTTVSGLTKIKLFHRLAVVFGLISDIVVSVLQSAATMNPATWITQTGLVLFNINSRMISNIAALQSGVSGVKALQLSLAIWGHLFVFYFGIKFFSRIAEEMFAGDTNPTIPMYFFIGIFVLAPVQMVAGLLAQGLQGEGVQLSKEVIPYSGVYEVVTHSGLWIEPVKQVIPDISGLGLGSSGNEADAMVVS